MDIQLKSPTPFSRELTAQISKEEVNNEFMNAYKYLRKRAEIPGFRKGRAPIQTIRQMYAGPVGEDVAKKLVHNALHEGLSKHSFLYSTQPQIDSLEVAHEDQPFELKAQFNAIADFKLQDYSKICVKKVTKKVTQEQCNQMINMYLNHFSDMEEVTIIRGVMEGDFVTFDIRLLNQNTPTSDNINRSQDIPLKKQTPFQKALLGLKPGEKKIVPNPDVKEEEKNENFLNINDKSSQYEVTIKKIQKRLKPDLTDEFVQKNFNRENVADFKKFIENEMQKKIDTELKEDLKKKILQGLIQTNPFPIPESMIEEQRKYMTQNYKEKLKERQFDDSYIRESIEKINQKLTENAEFQLRSSLLTSKIARENNLYIDDKNKKRILEDFRKKLHLSPKEFKSFLSENNEESFIAEVQEQRVFDFLFSKVQILEDQSMS